MQRVAIRRITNGVKMEIGEYVLRRGLGDLGFGRSAPERTVEYGAPTVFKRNEKATVPAWPAEAPPAAETESIYGDRSACGDYLVAKFSRPKGYDNPEIIVRWADVEGFAQALANSPLAQENDRRDLSRPPDKGRTGRESEIPARRADGGEVGERR